MVISLMILVMFSCFGIGFSEATTAIIGNLTGGQQPKKAYRTFIQLLPLEILITWTVAISVIWNTESIAYFFATEDDDPLLYETLTKTIPIAILVPMQFIGSTLGSINGLGIQKKITPLFIICQYCLALPIGLYYGMTKEMGVKAFLIA